MVGKGGGEQVMLDGIVCGRDPRGKAQLAVDGADMGVDCNAWRSIRLSMLVLAPWDIRSQNRRLKGVVVVKRALFTWMSQVASTGGKSTPLASRRHGWREDRCGVCFPPVAHMLAVSGNLVLALMDLHHVPHVARQRRRFASHPHEALAWVLDF